MPDRKPRDTALLERRIRSLINTAADWRARALNAEREVERLKALLTSTEAAYHSGEGRCDDPQCGNDCQRPSAEPITPPTLDLDAVREALTVAFQRSRTLGPLCDALGITFPANHTADRHDCERIADALLAAVSRTAEARGESA